jgi:hypothetical protein
MAAMSEDGAFAYTYRLATSMLCIQLEVQHEHVTTLNNCITRLVMWTVELYT